MGGERERCYQEEKDYTGTLASLTFSLSIEGSVWSARANATVVYVRANDAIQNLLLLGSHSGCPGGKLVSSIHVRREGERWANRMKGKRKRGSDFRWTS